MHLESHHTLNELDVLAKQHRQGPLWGKIRALVLVKKGESPERIAEVLGCAVRSVYNWVDRYNQGGVEALHRQPGQGRKPRFPREKHDQLRARLEAGPTPEDGVCTFRGRDVQRILREEFGVELAEASTYELLRRIGFSNLAPRPIHRKTDPQAQEEFKKKPAVALGRSNDSIPTSRFRSGSPTKPGLASKGR